MSFGSFLKDAAVVVGNSVTEQVQKVKELKEEYDSLDDSELLSILESSGWGAKSPTQKNVAMQILKNRGYDEDLLRSARKS